MREEILGGAWRPGRREKHLSLPAASEEATVLSPAPDPPGRYPCPCCGCLTFPVPREEAIAFICPVCLWENDVFDPGEDSPSDENRGMTLRQGRKNYRRLGAVREDLVRYARPPKPEEVPPKGSAPAMPAADPCGRDLPASST